MLYVTPRRADLAMTETILFFGHRISLFRPDLEHRLLGGITVLKSMHCNTFTRKCQCLRWLHPFMLLSAVDGSSCCSTSLPTLYFVRFKTLTNLLVVQWYPIVVPIWISWLLIDNKHIFKCLLAVWIFILGNACANVLPWWGCLSFSLHILDTFLCHWCVLYLPLLWGLPSHCRMVLLNEQKFLILT